MRVALERHLDPEPGPGLPLLVWRLPAPRPVASTAAVGGGLGLRRWALNAQVPPGYARADLDVHVAELAAAAGLEGEGAALLTAADVDDVTTAEDDGVQAWATVGLRLPTWAAATGHDEPWAPGTINVVVAVPAALQPGALVNLVATATEAKAQALWEAGVPGTGTASDAVVVIGLPDGAGLPAEGEGDPALRFGGPRSAWGARTARAVHAAVTAGIPRSRARIEAHR